MTEFRIGQIIAGIAALSFGICSFIIRAYYSIMPNEESFKLKKTSPLLEENSPLFRFYMGFTFVLGLLIAFMGVLLIFGVFN